LVEFEGKGVSFISMWFYDVRLELELQDPDKSQLIDLNAYHSAIILPPAGSMQVVQVVSPSELDLQLDDYCEQSKPISFSGSVVPASGYIIIDRKFNLDSVKVKGPKSLVSKIALIQIDSLRVNDVKTSFEKTVTLSSPNSQLLILEPEKVEVSFNIQLLSEQMIYDIPITLKNVPSNLLVEVKPKTLSLRIKGGEKIVSQIKAEHIKAEIDFAKDYRKDRTYYSAAISVPENVSWIESRPKTFELHIKKKN
jgi:YbbR domain-containing protein